MSLYEITSFPHLPCGTAKSTECPLRVRSRQGPVKFFYPIHKQSFPEPALFVVRPDRGVQIADVANAPFVRPDPDMRLGGLKFIPESDDPVWGTGG